MVPPPPRSPSPRAKKLIHAYAGKQLAYLLGGFIFLLVGAPLTLVFCRDLPGELALTMGHERCAGRVTATQLQENVEINDRHPTLISYEYEVSGQTFRAESSMLEPGALAEGSAVQVEYRAGSPQLSRIEGGTYGTFPLFTGFVGIFPLVGLMLMGSAVRSNRREIRAFRDGAAAHGLVSRVGLDTTVSVNGKHPLKVEWTFDVLGQSHGGSLSSLDHSKLSDFREGQPVTVLYLPDDPGANTLWVE